MADIQKPLSELLPGLNQPAEGSSGTANQSSSSDPAGAALQALAGKGRRPPINLPRHTFIWCEDDTKRDQLIARLQGQDEFVYPEDFRQPVFDAVQAFFGINYGADMKEVVRVDVPAKRLFNEILAFASWDTLCDRMKARVEEVEAMQAYRFVMNAGEDRNRIRKFIDRGPLHTLVISFMSDFVMGEVMNEDCMELKFARTDTVDHVMEVLGTTFR